MFFPPPGTLGIFVPLPTHWSGGLAFQTHWRGSSGLSTHNSWRPTPSLCRRSLHCRLMGHSWTPVAEIMCNGSTSLGFGSGLPSWLCWAVPYCAFLYGALLLKLWALGSNNLHPSKSGWNLHIDGDCPVWTLPKATACTLKKEATGVCPAGRVEEPRVGNSDRALNKILQALETPPLKLM